MKKKYQLRFWVIISIILICLCGIIYYSYKIINWKLNVDENEKIKKDTQKDILVNKETLEYSVDFESLKKRNPDTIAFIKVNNTNISYVVVKGNDNKYYLNHNFDKNKNAAGWIFGDYHNQFDGTDKNLIIYGHNTTDGSMFGTLINVLEHDWSDNLDNRKVILVTENQETIYQVFSTYSVIPEDYYINTKFNSNEEFNDFVQTLKLRSTYDYGIEVNGEDHIITLSSCIGEGHKRVVLHAKRIEA